MGGPIIQYSGHHYFRHRLVLSILSGKPVKIDKIRTEDKNPGLRDFEVSLLRLLEKVTNGTVVEISVTGTAILLTPGIIAGGPLVHDCSLTRSVGYFLEPIIMLAPFAKRPLQLTLRGITTDDNDLSIKKRGALPGGGGEVQFLCPIVKQVKTLNFVEPGKIKRIRGISHAVRVNPQFSNRMIETARSILNRYIPDIYLYSDVYKGEESGKSPGYALTLLAESTTSALFCSEATSKPGIAPEDIALQATRALLSEISKGGCIDEKHQGLVLLLMVLGSEDVGRCRMSQPTSRTIQFLRDIQDFFGTSFKITSSDPSKPDASDLLYSCYGTGYVNANRNIA
ncbi:hypothetical protein D9757_003724 [Collybiopsis confluens]|uniref:RNA 3'-terminal phosphate cyclase-like protein n=1 Tax=Collybiopsis confluens TaxID=2823264 RepID=A0A8H5HUG8_9AGAR|nr:hypothetical protein D9757_003724 [Collybiopsis confluens]